MYSRVTLVEIDTVRASVAEAVAYFENDVLPGLRGLDGYEGVLLLANPDGKGMVVTLWDSAEAADAAADFATGAVEAYVTRFKSPPGREHYEVVHADLPALTVD